MATPQTGTAPTSANQTATMGYVDGRTPPIQVVSAIPGSPVAGTLYVLTP